MDTQVSSPRIIVKLHDDVQLPYERHAERDLPAGWHELWGALGPPFAVPALKPALTALPPAEIEALVKRAMELDPEYCPPNFLTYFEIEFPAASTPAVAAIDPAPLVRALRQWTPVEAAYVESPVSDAFVDPDSDQPGYPMQVYLDPAPDGIDAEFVWPRLGGAGFPGGDGAGIRLIDMEQGWTLDHEDLPPPPDRPTLLNAPSGGAIRPQSRAHGTAVLGIVCAADNTVGCVGIAPGIEKANVVSCFGGPTKINAILSAIAALRFGDVLLLEVELSPSGRPIEVEDDVFHMIRLATALGIVVVEAGGNGISDLDSVTNAAGKQVLNRGSADFRDSGAIVVGAATPDVPHERWTVELPTVPPIMSGTNFGSRVDCYAWGDGVCTLTSANGATTGITTGFRGTSAAAAIVAGAAVVVQGMAVASLQHPISPRQMRLMLSDKSTGTRSHTPDVDRIGVMPNLRKIAEGGVLNLAPDIYVRDSVGDVGDPHTGALSMSPDVFVMGNAHPGAQMAFGEGSGTENTILGSAVTGARDNFVYVRMRNRGGSIATNVRATVYWAPLASLLTPDLWTPIGSVSVPSVPTGNLLTVSPPIVWPRAQVPGSGTYGLLAIVGHAQDPPPPLETMLDWDMFRRFLRDNNNIAWHNVGVMSITKLTWQRRFIPLRFIVPGPPDYARRMHIDVIATLPAAAVVLVEMPRPMQHALGINSAPFEPVDPEGRVVRRPVHPRGMSSLGEMLIPARSRMSLTVLVDIPADLRGEAYEISVRQRMGEEEVGRVTWRLVPGETV